VGTDMTTNGLLGELVAWTGLAAPTPASTEPMMTSGSADALAQGDGDRVRVGSILDVCDRVLGESSARRHVFSWLQPSGSDLLAVDAYYAGHKLVVLCAGLPAAHEALCAELVPAHSLRLFWVDLADFQADPGQAFSRLIGELRLIGDGAPPAPTALPREAPAFISVRIPDPGLPTATDPFAAPTEILPSPPPAAPPRQSMAAAFEPLRAAVHRFTAAPEPFVVPPEPAVVTPEPLPAFESTPAPAPFVSALPLPAPPRSAMPASPEPRAAAVPQAFIATPLPFALTAPPPLAPVLESLIAEPEVDLKRPRVGQRQAEAAARAARFVDARAAGPRPRVAPGPPARPTPPSRPGQWWNGAMGAPATMTYTAAADPVLDLDGHAVSPSTARAEAIERALARGRAVPDPQRPPPIEPTRVEPDDIMLGFVVACIAAIELYIGVALFTFGGGPVVLGLGLALDAAARAVGTAAAARSGREWGSGWRWLCAVGGSPAVAAFVFQKDGSLLATDLAPLAGPIAVVAMIVILIGLAGIPAGI